MALPAELVQTTPGDKLAKAHRDCRRRYPPHDLGILTRAPLDTEGWLRRELLIPRNGTVIGLRTNLTRDPDSDRPAAK